MLSGWEGQSHTSPASTSVYYLCSVSLLLLAYYKTAYFFELNRTEIQNFIVLVSVLCFMYYIKLGRDGQTDEQTRH